MILAPPEHPTVVIGIWIQTVLATPKHSLACTGLWEGEQKRSKSFMVLCIDFPEKLYQALPQEVLQATPGTGGNTLGLCDHSMCTAPNLPTDPTATAPRKNLHEAVICKISDPCFILSPASCLGNGSPAGTAPAQQLHCFSTSTNTRKVRQSPVCAGSQPALYYYVLLVHSEKCALQEKKKAPRSSVIGHRC